MKSTKPTKKAMTDEGESFESRASELILMAFRMNKSRMKTLTEKKLKVILDRSMKFIDQPIQDIVIDPADLEYDFELDMRPAPPKAVEASGATVPSKVDTSGSVSITIRIPAKVLTAFKKKAREKCMPYQTLMNRQLHLALAKM